MNVIGYSFDADTHCTYCTGIRFPYGETLFQHDPFDTSVDSEGNAIHPIFGDQGVNPDDGQNYCCGDCFVDLVTGDGPELHVFEETNLMTRPAGFDQRHASY